MISDDGAFGQADFTADLDLFYDGAFTIQGETTLSVTFPLGTFPVTVTILMGWNVVLPCDYSVDLAAAVFGLIQCGQAVWADTYNRGLPFNLSLPTRPTIDGTVGRLSGVIFE